MIKRLNDYNETIITERRALILRQFKVFKALEAHQKNKNSTAHWLRNTGLPISNKFIKSMK